MPDLSSDDLRATALGTFHIKIGFVALSASLIAGLLWQIAPAMTFIYDCMVVIISVVLFIVLEAISWIDNTRFTLVTPILFLPYHNIDS